MTRVVSYLFDDHDDARRAVQALENAGFDETEVSLVARSADGTVTNDEESSGAATGASVGGVAGAGAGLLASLGVMAIPGIGPLVAAGMLATTLVTTAGGAVAGGLLGALTDYGVDESDANLYAEGIRRGSSLVTVRTDDGRGSQADSILRQHNPVDHGIRRDEYEQSGWTPSNQDNSSQVDSRRPRSGTYR